MPSTYTGPHVHLHTHSGTHVSVHVPLRHQRLQQLCMELSNAGARVLQLPTLGADSIGLS